MPSIVGIDSRIFKRESIKSNGQPGHFESVLGVAVKVKDYASFDKHYQIAMQYAFSAVGRSTDYAYYCINDLRDFGDKDKYKIIEMFVAKIAS